MARISPARALLYGPSMRLPSPLAIALALSGLTALVPTEASACGGCFAPSGQPSPVVAHRMALLIGEDSTTLWDQFEYRGNPEEFAWVLPVRGTDDVTIELSDNVFFEALGTATQIQLQGPNLGSGGGRSGIGCASASGGDARSAAPPMGPVMVYSEAVVGPYETSVIGSEDPDALLMWLQESGYFVSDELLPVIRWYVERDMNFLALRLAPNEGVSRIQPVRVTTPGALGALPLRMIAAGVVENVALELFVFGSQRYEPMNFPSAEVDRDELVFRLDTSTYNYDELATAALTTDDGFAAWLTEYARLSPSLDAFRIFDESTGESRTPEEDWAFIQSQLPNPYLTRMRADLPLNALGDDLVLRASDGDDLDGFIWVDRAVNRTRSGARVIADEDFMLAGAPAPLAALMLIVVGLGLKRRRC